MISYSALVCNVHGIRHSYGSERFKQTSTSALSFKAIDPASGLAQKSHRSFDELVFVVFDLLINATDETIILSEVLGALIHQLVF